MRLLYLAAAIATVCFATSAAASDLEVRFCPAGVLHSYPASEERKVRTLVVQNIAVVNTSAAPAEVTSIQIDLLRGGEAIDTRRFTAADVERAGKNSIGLQGSGMLDLAPFQFCGHDMIPAGVKLGGQTLAPQEALWVSSQSFSWRGDRDGVRVTATVMSGGRTQVLTAALPLSDAPAPVAFRFPLSGVWYAWAGPTLHSHHRWGVQEEFAFDLVRLDARGLTHTGDGARFADYYAYGQVVMAAAEGRVVAAVNNVAEDPQAMRRAGETDVAYMDRLMADQAKRLAEGANSILGNHVVIDHGGGVFTVSAHLQPGSVLVKPGDVVKVGQPIGKLGTSGNSTEPHLHWQACGGPNPLFCAGLPASFTGVTLPLADLPRQLQTGDIIVAP